MTADQTYRVLLYYKFTPIDDPVTFSEEHLAFCQGLGLKGRILVAQEGLNGTVSGTVEQTEQYMEAMHQDPRFADMTFKIDAYDRHAFKKMHVRHRSEIVSMKMNDDEDVSPLEKTAAFLSPKEFYDAMQEEETVILDARNDYEYDLGHFRGAIRPDINAFRELPDWIHHNKDQLKDKKVLTYCTGGIRCEKFTGWLMEEGIQNVGQLDGGIVSYGQDPEVQGDLWDGQCYVFDERISVPINQNEHTVIGRDYFDGQPCERYVNCANPPCNKQIICSEKNEHKYMRGCTHECRVSRENLYVREHSLSQEDVHRKLAVIEEENRTKQKA